MKYFVGQILYAKRFKYSLIENAPYEVIGVYKKGKDTKLDVKDSNGVVFLKRRNKIFRNKQR